MINLDQRDYDKKPLSRNEIIFVSLFAAAFLGLLAMEIFSNFQPRKLSALFFILAWIPLLFIHEMGHALMAWSLNWEVKKIHLGFGHRLYQGKIFNTPIEIRAIPFEGFVQTQPKQPHHYSGLSNALIYFAGPGIELLIFFSLLGLFGSDWMFTVQDNYATLALQSFAFAALASAIINLIPLGIITREGTTPNDGLGILLSLFAGKNRTN